MKRLLAFLIIYCITAGFTPILASETAQEPSLTKIDIASQLEEYGFGSNNKVISIEATTRNNKDYAYVYATGGLYVFDITDPYNLELILSKTDDDNIKASESHPCSLILYGDYVIVGSGNGYITCWFISPSAKTITRQGNIYHSFGRSRGMKVYGDYLFAASDDNNAGIRVYHLPTFVASSGNSALSIQLNEYVRTYAFCVGGDPSGTPMLYALTRDTSNVDYFVTYEMNLNPTITSTTFTEKSTKTTKKTGTAPEIAAELGVELDVGQAKDMTQLDSDTVMIITGESDKMRTAINVSNSESPSLKENKGATQINASSIQAVDDNYYVFGTEWAEKNYVQLFKHNNGIQESGADIDDSVKTVTTGARVWQTKEHNGYLLVANDSAGFGIYSTKPGVSIWTTSINFMNPVIIGKAQGYITGDVVKIKIGDVETTATMNGSLFRCELDEMASETTMNFTSELHRGDIKIAEATEEIAIDLTPPIPAEKSLTLDELNIQSMLVDEDGNAIFGDANKAISVETVTYNQRDYAYVLATGGFFVFDITNLAEITPVPMSLGVNSSANPGDFVIGSKHRSNSMVLYKDYVIINGSEGNIQVWRVLPSEGIYERVGNISHNIGANNFREFKIAGNYLIAMSDSSTIGGGVRVFYLPKMVTRTVEPPTDDGEVTHIPAEFILNDIWRYYQCAIEQISEDKVMLYCVGRRASDAPEATLAVYELNIGLDPAYDETGINTKPLTDFRRIVSETSMMTLNENLTESWGYEVQSIILAAPKTLMLAGARNDYQRVSIDVSTPESPGLIQAQKNSELNGRQINGAGTDSAQLSASSGSGGVWQMKEFNGNLLVSSNQTGLKIYKMFPSIKITSEDIVQNEITGRIDNYKQGDIIRVSIGGASSQVLEADDNGKFSLMLDTILDEEVPVYAVLIRDDVIISMDQKDTIISESNYVVGAINSQLQPDGSLDATVTVKNLCDDSGKTVSLVAVSFSSGKMVNATVKEITLPQVKSDEFTINIKNSPIYDKVKVFALKSLSSLYAVSNISQK